MKVEDKKVSKQSIMGLYSLGAKRLLVTLCTTEQYSKYQMNRLLRHKFVSTHPKLHQIASCDPTDNPHTNHRLML